MTHFLFLATLVGVFVHEFGHLIALRFFGCKGRLVFRKSWVSPVVVEAEVAESTKLFITVAIAGPFASLVYGLAFLPFDLLIASWVIFWGTLLQLLPVKGSDGWHIEQALRKRKERNA